NCGKPDRSRQDSQRTQGQSGPGHKPVCNREPSIRLGVYADQVAETQSASGLELHDLANLARYRILISIPVNVHMIGLQLHSLSASSRGHPDSHVQNASHYALRCIHFHAVDTISWRERLGRHPSTCWARLESATRAGGSPARRGAIERGTARPVIRSTVLITSITE